MINTGYSVASHIVYLKVTTKSLKYKVYGINFFILNPPVPQQVSQTLIDPPPAFVKPIAGLLFI